jgi:hypothetical protein
VPHIKHTPVEVETKETLQASKGAVPARPAKVVAFPPLKEAPAPKKPEVIGSREFADMSLADKREFILAAVKAELLPEAEYNKMVFMLGLIKSDATPNVIDLEDEKVLTDLMVEWAHLIEPDALAGVISALRDCEDDQRRTAIIDNMISKVFEYGRTRNITESDWRLQVERRLPEKLAVPNWLCQLRDAVHSKSSQLSAPQIVAHMEITRMSMSLWRLCDQCAGRRQMKNVEEATLVFARPL